MSDIDSHRTIHEPQQGFNEISRNGKTYLDIISNNELIENKGIRVQFSEDLDKQYAIFKIDGRLYCLDNICPHRHADRIHQGLIHKEKMTVTCPLHGWTYSLETGENVNKLQGLKSLAEYEVFELDDRVYMEKPNFQAPKWRR